MEQGEPQEEPTNKRETWYSIHKEQIKLVQWLLYHLRKHDQQKEPTGQIVKEYGDFKLEFK